MSGEQIREEKSFGPFSKMAAHGEEKHEDRKQQKTKQTASEDSWTTNASVTLERPRTFIYKGARKWHEESTLLQKVLLKSTPLTDKTEARDSKDKLVTIGMEHVVKRHMLPVPYGKSFFLSTDVKDVCNMVEEAIKRPDQTFPHRDDEGKKVFKKNFGRQIGILGYSQKECYCVTVILDNRSNALITAFPTVK